MGKKVNLHLGNVGIMNLEESSSKECKQAKILSAQCALIEAQTLKCIPFWEKLMSWPNYKNAANLLKFHFETVVFESLKIEKNILLE